MPKEDDVIAGPENGAYSCGTVALDDFESRKSAIAFWVLQAFLVRRYRHVNSQFALKGAHHVRDEGELLGGKRHAEM